MRVCVRWLLLAVLTPLTDVWVSGSVVRVQVGPSLLPPPRTRAVLARGQAAELVCDVSDQGDRQVSWVRSWDLQILSHGGAVFTADARVSATARALQCAPGRPLQCAPGRVTRHTLRVERLRPADSGRYECQLNTEPKMSLFFNLTVVDEEVPRVVVSASSARGVVGGAAELWCAAEYRPAPRLLPPPPLRLTWARLLHGAARPLQRVSVDRERWAGGQRSRLLLQELSPEDAGDYRCSTGDDSVDVTLVVDESPLGEAMQRDQSVPAAGARVLPPLPLLLALLARLVCRLL